MNHFNQQAIPFWCLLPNQNSPVTNQRTNEQNQRKPIIEIDLELSDLFLFYVKSLLFDLNDELVCNVL